MQNIQDAISHFSQGTRLLEANMGRVMESWMQLEQIHLAQRATEERWRQMERRLGTVMEERWRQLEERLESMVMERVEALVMQRMEVMITQVVEAKVGKRLERLELKFSDGSGDRETGEASPDIPGLGGRPTDFLRSEDTLGVRVRALEKSVQKALEVMFPRVEALLCKMEEQPVSAYSARAPTELRVSHPSLPSSCAPPRSPQSNAAGPSLSSLSQNHLLSSQNTSLSAMLISAAEGRTGEVISCLEAGTSINSRDSHGNTALYWAASRGHSGTLFSLLERGADVNCRNIDGWTPLHAAAQSGLTSCISLLLDAGASIESKTMLGQSPLHVAANCGHEQFVQALLVEGARINVRDNEGRTPLSLTNSPSVRRLFRH